MSAKTGLKAGSPRQQKSQKEASLEAVRKVDDEPELKRLNVNLPAPLMNKLKGKVGLEGKKINEVVIQLINEYLK
jgi:hypothetical protein